MKHILRNRVFFVFCIAVLMSLVTIPATAQKSVEKAKSEARESTQLLTNVMSDASKAIPRSVLRSAEGIAIFTNVKKGGFIVGGPGGDGVVMRRVNKTTWGPPAFYDMGGMDIGLQAGAKEGDFILVFMTPGSMKDLLENELQLGASIGMAAGPVGEQAGVTNDKNSNIYVYSHSAGAFAGATVGGGSIKPNNSINEALYKMKGGAVLTNPSQVNMSTLPAELQSLSKLVAQYSN
jgi:lipid-binding SYLF domain-containing protein